MMNKRTKQLFSTVVVGVISVTISFAQTIQEGLYHLNSERFNEAEQVFSKLTQATPSAENFYYQGYYYLRTNQLDKATASFEKGAQADSKDLLNSVGLGAVALAKGDKAKATELFQNAEKKKKKDAEILFRIGEAYTLFEKNTDPAEAIRLIDEAVKKDTKLADAYIAKGDALSMKNEGGPAVTAYEYALTAKPNYAVANNRIGQIYLRGKNYNEALAYYKKAIDADPDFAPAYKDLAELYFFARQYKRAAENYDTYISKSKTTDPDVTLRAAQLIFTADDYSRALALLDSVQGKVNNPIMLRMYGWSYFKTNEMDKAISNLTKFIEQAPDKVIADDYKYLGRAYNKQATDGKEYTAKGMEFLMKGADIDTSAAEAAATYKELGGIYFKDKQYPDAIKTFSKGIALDTVKASTNDYYYLGLANYQAGVSTVAEAGPDSVATAEKRANYFAEADNTFGILGVKIPDWPISYYWRAASLYAKEGQAKSIESGAALPHYEKFIELAEPEADKYKAFLIRGYQYVASYNQITANNAAKAKEYWERILKLDPNNAAAKEALK